MVTVEARLSIARQSCCAPAAKGRSATTNNRQSARQCARGLLRAVAAIVLDIASIDGYCGAVNFGAVWPSEPQDEAGECAWLHPLARIGARHGGAVRGRVNRSRQQDV